MLRERGTHLHMLLKTLFTGLKVSPPLVHILYFAVCSLFGWSCVSLVVVVVYVS